MRALRADRCECASISSSSSSTSTSISSSYSGGGMYCPGSQIVHHIMLRVATSALQVRSWDRVIHSSGRCHGMQVARFWMLLRMTPKLV